MANVDAAFGFVPIRHMSATGSVYTNKYTIASTLAENIFSGDLCVLDAGYVTPHTATEVQNIGVFVSIYGSSCRHMTYRHKPKGCIYISHISTS